MTDTDFAALAEPVARHFWGDPNKSLSNKTSLRWGDGGSRVLYLDGPGNWRDFASDEQGGVIDLVMRETGADRPGAIEWLQTEGFIPEREGRTAPQPRQERHEAPPEDNGPPEDDRRPEDAPAAQMKPVKGYRYTDRDGNPLYEVIRYQFQLADGSWQVDSKTGNPKKTFRQRRKVGDEYKYNLDGVGHTIYRHREVEIAIAEGKPIYLCYSPDTEVLTSTGWVMFPDLVPGTPVAQYDIADGGVSFCVPKAHQRFRYVGEMVNIKADWCDLLVTPDHRQPHRYVSTKGMSPPKIGPASTIRGQHKIPAAGAKRDGEEVIPLVASLMVAWLGDGVWEPRGGCVSWNLKKPRKMERLRSLLSQLAIEWTEHEYRSTPGWRAFRVRKSAIEPFFRLSADKQWPWEMLGWSLASRRAALDELAFWDGDAGGTRTTRFFTSERQSADVVSAIAAISGKSSGLRVDRRAGKNDSYVVNLNEQDWRKISRTPARTTYDGEVFCCTVDTGVLVVRRNGKVTISGNCEGEKDVETLESWGLVASTNSGGAQHWTPEHADLFRGADVVILVDNDEAGRSGALKRAKSLCGIAGRVRVLDLAEFIPGFPAKLDVTDWKERFSGDAEQLSAFIGKLPTWTPPPPTSVFGSTHVADVGERRKHRRHAWLVYGFIEMGGICSFSGASQAGKTFAVTELAFCVARGEKFFGRDVKQGLVIYQVGEGDLGFEKRLDGYARDRGLGDMSGIPFIYWPRKINLFVDDKDAEAIIAEGKAQEAYYGQKLRLFVIDTWNKATRGADEISGRDMGRVIERAERIAAALDCTVMVVDHVNKGGDLRGHGSKSQDVTNTIKVVLTDKVDQNGRKIRRMQLDKNKDGENGLSISFVLRQVVVGEDEFGRTETTCVTEPPDGNEDEIVASGRLPPNMAFMLRAIRDTADIEGHAAPPELVQVPPGRNVAPWDAFMTRMRKTWGYTASDPKLRDKELARVVADAGKRLLLAGYIGRDNDRGLIWWSGKEDRFRPQRTVEPPKPSPLMTAADMDVPF